MSHAEEMLRTHPQFSISTNPALAACIEACFECAQTCTMCADACLGEEHVAHLRRCIRLNLDCADICAATGRLLARQTETDWMLIRSQVQVCLTACQLCATECEQHASMHEHCRVCAEACRRCEAACQALLTAIAA